MNSAPTIATEPLPAPSSERFGLLADQVQLELSSNSESEAQEAKLPKLSRMPGYAESSSKQPRDEKYTIERERARAELVGVQTSVR